jgi:hypothetical protein
MKNNNSSVFLYHYIYNVFGQFGKVWKKRFSVGASILKTAGIFVLLIALTGSFSACKTCKCPAYSYQAEGERVREETGGDI